MGVYGGFFQSECKLIVDGAGRRTLKNAPSWQPRNLRPVTRRDGPGRRTFVFFMKTPKHGDVFDVSALCFAEKTRFFH